MRMRRTVAGTVLLLGCIVALSALVGCEAASGGRSQADVVHKGGTVASTTAPAAVPETRPTIIVNGHEEQQQFPLLNTRSDPQSATTAPAAASAEPGELLQDKSAMAFGNAAETFRLVNRRDEIVSILHNGAAVIVKRVPSPVTTVRGYCFTGGVYEGKWLGGGLSHLLEHLVAGGSNQRRTEQQNRDLLQKIGNNSNAYTNYDQTSFFINTTTDFMADAVDLVTGWMLGAQITVPEYRREYQVVQRELEMGKGEPDRVFYYLTEMNRYRVSPARIPVIGYQEVIQGLSRDDVYSYYKLAYVPNNMLFVVAGNQDPEVMLKAVQKNLADAKPGRAFSHDIAAEPPVLTPRTAVATFPKLGEARLQLAFPTVKLDSPDLYALDLLAAVLGGGESSMMVEQIRDEKQLVSAIEVGDETPTYADGTFAVQMQLDPDKVQQATDAVLALLEQVKTKPIGEERLQRAKAQMKADRVKKLQTSEEIGDALAQDYMSAGDPHFTDKYLERIDKLTPADVRDAAARYFDRSRLLTTALLPADYVGAQGLPKAEDLLRPVAPTTAPGPEKPASPIVRSELPDGTVLLVKRISTSPLVTMQLYSLGGVTDEDEKTNGLGNLAMQMLPRGTKTRSAQQIAEFFDSIGGDLETVSGNNTWMWNTTCLKQDLGKAMEVYADVIEHPAFADAELAGMKRRIAAAIAQQDANWTAQASRFFKKEYYGPLGSPYQFMPVGTQENVTKFTAEQVRHWYSTHILHGKKVLAIFGDVDPAEAEKLAKQYLGRTDSSVFVTNRVSITLPSTQPSDAKSESNKPHVVVRDVKLNKTEQALAGVMIGYDAEPVVGDPSNFPLTVGDTLASGFTYPTGYIFETLRGLGLVYVADAQNIPGREKALPGTFMVYAGCDPKNVNQVVDLILENIARLQGTDQEMNVNWFKRAKELIVVADAMEQETPGAQAQQAALDELMGLGYDWHRQFAGKIRAVSLDDVRRTARQRLRQCVVTVSTPAPEKVNIKTGLREYTSFPPVNLTPRGVQHDTGGAK